LENGEIKLFQDLRPALRHGNEAAIVPPLAEKETPDWLKPVWHVAERLLSQADTWIVCGYSLPNYDIAINDLLRSTAKSNLRHLYILDPYSEPLRKKYASIAPDADVVCLSGLPKGTEELALLLRDNLR
jgi:sugar/nucleoside kinase (ribokinase family)